MKSEGAESICLDGKHSSSTRPSMGISRQPNAHCTYLRYVSLPSTVITITAVLMFRTLFTTSRLARCAVQASRTKISYSRGFRTTTPRTGTYKRFSDQDQGRNPRNHPLDWRRWDPPVKMGVVLLAGGVYYFAQYALCQVSR